MVEGDHAAVDPGSHAAMPHLGVNPIGEVHRGRLVGQVDDVAAGGEDEDLVGQKVDLQMLDVLLGIPRIGLPIQDGSYPGVDLPEELRLRAAHRSPTALLVGPVGRDASLVDLVHLPGANLDLDRLVARSVDGGVQRAIVVGLRLGDVVLDPIVEGNPQRVDGPQGAVALLDAVHDDPDSQKIVDLVDGAPGSLHLAVDAVEVLGAPLDPGIDPQVQELLADGLHRLDGGLLAAGLVLQDLGLQVGVLVGQGVAEREVLQLALELPHAQARGDGRKDLQGFLGDPGLLVRAQRPQGAHVVQPVGQLDQDDPQIASHGQEDLAQVLGLGRLLGERLGGIPRLAGRDRGQLGDPVHQHGDFFAEVFAEVFQRGPGVLHDVVQEGGRQGGGIQPIGGQDVRHLHRMEDVGLSRGAELPLVSGQGHLERSLDGLPLGRVQVKRSLADQALEVRHRGFLGWRRRGGQGIGHFNLGGWIGLWLGARLLQRWRAFFYSLFASFLVIHSASLALSGSSLYRGRANLPTEIGVRGQEMPPRETTLQAGPQAASSGRARTVPSPASNGRSAATSASTPNN